MKPIGGVCLCAVLSIAPLFGQSGLAFDGIEARLKMDQGGNKDRLGGMRLLPGYEHKTRQGYDTLLGEIKKDGGLLIKYEIAHVPVEGKPRLAPSFTDEPKQTPKDELRWYREQEVNGQPVHMAYRNDNVLLVSFPNKGMNMSVTVKSVDEMAEALLMILTYPNPPAEMKDKQPK